MYSTLELQRVSKKHWHPESERPYILSEITAAVGHLDRVAIIGTSGQGKSTLLKLLARLDHLDDGDLLLNGQSSKLMDTRLWRMQVSYVAQFPVMFEGSIAYNLQTVSRLHGTPYDNELAAQLMLRAGLDYLDPSKPVADLSGGEKQRIALIRTLMLRPSFLMLDEVTASLDQHNTKRIEELLLGWSEQNQTALLWVTHDMEQADRFSTKTWIVEGGSLSEHQSVPKDYYKQQSGQAPRTEGGDEA